MSTKVRWLTEDEDRAWRAFRRVMVAVQTNTARDLAEIGLSEADFEVLSTLSERSGRTGSLGAQADKMGWSRSRLSRHASRMEERGLLRRDADPDDGRGCLLTLTDEGHAVLIDAVPAHVESVRRHFIDHLDAGQLAQLESIADAVVDRA
jgi:DNA-binding MarR family transcriptional regulator